ncbi:hypothetical protein EC991_004844 [Linnemannia zychae]|nr:hypothetical protein EC991_004844 [Linnemannia zychae]
MAPIFPSSLSESLSASSMPDGPNAMFSDSHPSYYSEDMEHILVAPELPSMTHAHEIEHSLADQASRSSSSSPFLNELQMSSQDRHHNDHHLQYRHSYQSYSAFQDLKEAQHLSMLGDMVHQSNSVSPDVSTGTLTFSDCAIHPTIRRTQSLETFSPLNRRMNTTLSAANAMMCSDFQSGTVFTGSQILTESSSTETYNSEYSSMLHQDAFQFPSVSMGFHGDQLCPSPSTPSTFNPSLQPFLTPTYSASSSCYSPETSTSSPCIDSMSITISESGRTTPVTPSFPQTNNYRSDYDSDIDDTSCSQKHRFTSTHSRHSSASPNSNACSDIDTQVDPSINDDNEEEDGNESSPRSFPCLYPNCNRSFGRSYNLKAHALTHGTFRPFPCRLCPRTFARIHDRDRHMSSHRTVKAYSCIVCLGRFARQDAVIRHLKLSSEMNPCSWILKSQGITFRDVAAGRVDRQLLGSEDDIIKAVETLENEIRKARAARALERMKIPKTRASNIN